MQFWAPHFYGDIGRFGRSEKNDKRMEGLLDMPYEGRMKEFGTSNLEKKRLRGSMILLLRYTGRVPKGKWSGIFSTATVEALRGGI